MTNPKTFALKGSICFSADPGHLVSEENAYVICENGKCAGVYRELPERFRGIPCTDAGNSLIIPGLTDLHLHAPQYSFRGTHMDLELLDWLDTVTFPEEARYADLEYAGKAYRIFADDLKKSFTTRACIFGTLHVEATELLMDLTEETGIKAYIGKVNMDRNGPSDLQEESAESSARATVRWLEDTRGKYRNVRPILTPRFIPSCSDELMTELSVIQKNYRLPVQSHLSENPGEAAWVKDLCPDSEFYGAAYDRFGLFGGEGCPTIMAHCVHSSEEEIALMKQRGVYVAHCPQSNTNLSSGIAPVRRFMEKGLNMGLGTDIAGGHSLSMLRTAADAVQVSKLRWRLADDSQKALSFAEAFYLASAGGGSFFGSTGAFLEGYDFDALILDDSFWAYPGTLTAGERLERLAYIGDERCIAVKYICGEKLL